jgi:class 3 adenylate cyclase/tetratricopeptide (TPR) repeat protein
VHVCPNCAAPSPDGAHFCPNCGHTLGGSRLEERRVVTILFADLVGFTALAECKDPELVKALVDNVFERLVADVTSFGGRVDKILGDAIVALFGAPVAHEDDAERAVRASLRMQRTFKEQVADLEVPMQMRVGVNTGEVLVGALRAGGDYTAMGDVVNTASRLQTAAPPGGVLVGPATQAATADAVAYEFVGDVEVRGREEKVPAWSAIEPLTLPGRRRRPLKVPLVGREMERSLLLQTINIAHGQRRAVLAVVEGDGGVGKTRLVKEVLSSGLEAAGTVLVGNCVPYGEANRWWPIASALAPILGVDLAEPTPDLRTTLEEKLGSLIGPAPDQEHRGALVNGLLHLFGEPSPLDEIDPARTHQELIRAVLAVLAALVARGPLTVVVADLHWASLRLLELLEAMLVRLASAPFALIATTRPGGELPTAPRSARITSLMLRLDPLGREAAEQLLQEMLGELATEALVSELYDRSGGNPLFLEELASLVACGAKTVQLPDSLRALVAARLDELPADQRAMLDNAAVLGSSGPYGALLEFGQALRQDTSRATLDGLADAGVLEVQGGWWRFRSASVREVAYHTITKADRARRHAGVARAMAAHADAVEHPDMVAHHWATAAELAAELGGGVPGVPADVAKRAVSALLASATYDVDRLYPRPAIEQVSRALALGGESTDGATRRALALARAGAWVELRQFPEAENDLQIVVDEGERAGDLHGLARARSVRAEIARLTGRYDDARAELEAAAGLFEQIGARGELAGVQRAWGMTSIFAGDFDDAEKHLDVADELYAAEDDRRGRAWVDQHRAWVSFVRGDVDSADQRLTAAAATLKEIGDRGGVAWALGLLAYVRLFQGRFAESEELGRLVVQEASERGDQWAEAMLVTLQALLALWDGRIDEAARRAGDAQRIFRAIGDHYGEIQAATTISRTLAAQGLGVDALRVAEEAIAMATPIGQTNLVESVTAGVALYAGQTALAIAHARIALDASFVAPGFLYDAYVTLALAHLQSGDVDRAMAFVEEAQEVRPDHPNGTQAKALVLAANGRPEEAVALARSVPTMPGNTYMDRFLAGITLGLAHAQMRDRAAAIAALDSASAGVAATDDAVAPVLVLQARAEVLRALDDQAGADAAQADVDRRSDVLDLDPAPWQHAFRLAARGADLAGAVEARG